MNEKITPELIRLQAGQLHGLAYGSARCAELARDVEHNNTAVSNAAGKLDFNDEPARFIALLSTHAQPRKQRA
jgi:hypothetical protein